MLALDGAGGHKASRLDMVNSRFRQTMRAQIGPSKMDSTFAMLGLWVALCLRGVSAANFDSWSLILLEDAAAEGAVCLDGSPGGYFFEPGSGTGAQKWIIHFQGGGWCTSLAACFLASESPLGSSATWAAQKDALLGDFAHGYMSNQAEVNPDMYNWNKVWALYCDGGSRAGNVDGPVTVDDSGSVYFRGAHILNATLDSLASAGLTGADDLIVTGESAGGLTALLHVDFISSRFPGVKVVVGMNYCGFFVDLPDAQGMHGQAEVWKWVFVTMNMRYSPSLSTDCFDAYADTPWQCFLAPNQLPFVKTPLFVLHSLYDSWQSSQTLQLPSGCVIEGTCSQEERDLLHSLRDAVSGNLSSLQAPSSYFLHSCVGHCELGLNDFGWTGLVVKGTSLREAFRSWLGGQSVFLSEGDVDPNANPTCAAAHVEPEGPDPVPLVTSGQYEVLGQAVNQGSTDPEIREFMEFVHDPTNFNLGMDGHVDVSENTVFWGVLGII
ncbi:PAE11 [Symbiodinium sp. CCMP2592]|nr:PAE11 [Symbiodinium sp. CCMP2592]